MKPSLGTPNPKQTTKPMMTRSDLEKYLVDRGIQAGTTECEVSPGNLYSGTRALDPQGSCLGIHVS